MLHEGRTRAPHPGGGSFLDSQGGPPARVAPTGCVLSSVASSTAPCQGSSGPCQGGSCRLLLRLQGATCALAPWGSLSPGKFAAGASSALPLAPFPQCFLLVQNSRCLEGLRACCTTRSCHFSALPACKTSAGQARERFSCIAGQEAQRSKFDRAERMLLIDRCHTLEDSPWSHTPRLRHRRRRHRLPILLLLLPPLLCVVGCDPRASSSHS